LFYPFAGREGGKEDREIQVEYEYATYVEIR
jgi:hypothetical protein